MTAGGIGVWTTSTGQRAWAAHAALTEPESSRRIPHVHDCRRRASDARSLCSMSTSAARRERPIARNAPEAIPGTLHARYRGGTAAHPSWETIRCRDRTDRASPDTSRWSPPRVGHRVQRRCAPRATTPPRRRRSHRRRRRWGAARRCLSSVQDSPRGSGSQRRTSPRCGLGSSRVVGPIAGHDEDGCVDVDEDVLDDRSEGMLAAMRVPCADDDECGIPGGVQQRFRRRPHGLARSQRGPRVQPLDESGRLLLSADADVSTGAGTIPENEECTTCSGSPRRAALSDAARTTGSSRSSAFTPATTPERKRRSRCARPRRRSAPPLRCADSWCRRHGCG